MLTQRADNVLDVYQDMLDHAHDHRPRYLYCDDQYWRHYDRNDYQLEYEDLLMKEWRPGGFQ